MGDITESDIQEGGQQTLPKQKVDRNAIQRLIDKLRSPETLEQVTGGTPVAVEDLTEQGPSPISPMDDFFKEKSKPEEQVIEGE